MTVMYGDAEVNGEKVLFVTSKGRGIALSLDDEQCLCEALQRREPARMVKLELRRIKSTLEGLEDK